MTAIDGEDGQLVFYGTDVGGLWRSTDGGQRFFPANIGIETTGVVGIAIDPLNKNRVLMIGDGGGNFYNVYGGVHLSTDQGATWSRRLSKQLNAVNNGRQNGRDQLAYDRSSYDQTLGYCLVAYWVSEDDRGTISASSSTRTDPKGSLYKTTDGGLSWSLAAEDGEYEGADDAYSRISVHPTLSHVYIANKNGFFRSVDGGASFVKTLSGSFTSLETVGTPGYENHVWTSTLSSLHVSTDGGASFSPIAQSGISGFNLLKVSPADPKRMLASSPSWKRFYSEDGGQNWTASQEDYTNSWLKVGFMDDNRRCHASWHPTDPQIVFGLGKGDQLMKSVDGGAQFVWSSNGINNVMLGSSFQLNAQNPDLIYYGSQDYNGAFTADRGASWKFINLDGTDPWGWVYGAYAKNSQVMFGGNRAYQASTYDLYITFDGGATRQRKVTNLTGIQVSYGAPADENTLFCWSQRSADGGVTWSKMADCDGVFTHHPTSLALYGAKGQAVKRSTDNGASWTTLTTLPASVTDVAVHPTLDRIWVAAGNKLYQCDGPSYAPTQILSGGYIRSVAVDPSKPETLYTAGTPGTWRKNANSVRRSLDGGATWHELNNLGTMIDGGNCAEWVRVHPTTSEAFVGTNCFGFWAFAPPEQATGTLLSPLADGQVRGGEHAETSFGTDPVMWVKDGAGDDLDRQSYLRFDLQDIGGHVEEAKLRLFAREVGVGAATYELLRVNDDSWTESELDWNNRPPAGETIASGIISVGGELVFDVTSYIVEQAVSDGKASLVLRRAETDTSEHVAFATKESPIAAERPQLEYHISQGPNGLELYRQEHGLAADGSEDDGAPAGDGIANLHKYAFNLGAPSTLAQERILSKDGTAGLPRIERDPQVPGGLLIEYIRRKATTNPGIVYRVYAGKELLKWSLADPVSSQIVEIDQTWERVRLTVPPSEGEPPHLFVQVSVSSNSGQ